MSEGGKTTIIVAIITLVGGCITAVISNWDKIFSNQNDNIISSKTFDGKYIISGISSTDIKYGGNFNGVYYCNYLTNFSNIKCNIDIENFDIIDAEVTCLSTESKIGDCPFDVIPPNNHKYLLSKKSFENNEIKIEFTPLSTNEPICSLIFIGKFENNILIGTFTWQRTDISPPLNFKISLLTKFNKI